MFARPLSPRHIYIVQRCFAFNFRKKDYCIFSDAQINTNIGFYSRKFFTIILKVLDFSELWKEVLLGEKKSIL